MVGAKGVTALRTKDPACFRAVAINDPHFSATAPPAFKVDYTAWLENNLKQVFELARRKNVDAIIWGGDLFHLKEPKNNPLWLIAKVITLLTDSANTAKLTHVGVGGNHDLRYGSLKTGLYGSPLDLVLASGQLTLLDLIELTFDMADGYQVRLAGGSYWHGRAEHVRDKKKQGANFLITVGHFWLGTQTGEFFGELLYGHDFFKDAEADIVIVGHHHEDKGVHKAHGKHFIAPGSISITGSFAGDLTRRPAATLIEVSRKGVEINVLRPRTPSGQDLIDVELHAALKKEKEETDAFIQSLATTEISAPDPVEILQQLAPPIEVRERAQNYIEQAETRK